MSDLKKCKTCGTAKQRTKSGNSYCATCKCNWSIKNKDLVRENNKKWRINNLDYSKQKSRQYYANNKDKILAVDKKRRDKIRPQLREYSKAYYLKNKKKWELLKETQHPLKNVWASMKKRCCNPNSKSYKNYGGRGISVCDRWKNSFDAFVEDMGPRPEGVGLNGLPLYSIERIDNDGNYEPGNCKWATDEEQRANKRPVIDKTISRSSIVEYLGECISLDHLSKLTGLHIKACVYRGSRCMNADFILQNGGGARLYPIDGWYYTATELSIISGITVSMIVHRLNKQKMSPIEAMTKPLRKR